MDSWLLVVLVVLATARLTKLIIDDYILEPVRVWVNDHAGDGIVYLIQCPWCVSIYVGAGVSVAAWAWRDQAWLIVALIALTASYLTGILELIVSKLEA